MAVSDKTAKEIKLDERNHVEKPFLDQLEGLGWTVIDCDSKQLPARHFRESFTEVVMLPVLREQLKVINPWLEDDQVEEVVKQLTASFPGTGLIQNNRHVLQLLLENTSVSENRKTGEKSPTVRFIDFKHRDNNSFIAVCQFKVRILGTEHHIYPDIVLFLNGLPVVVIECKSPKVKEPIPEAIDQLLRYSEQRGAKGEGSAPLFYLQPVRHRDVPPGVQVRHHHHAQRKALLPLGRPFPAHGERPGARRQQPERPAAPGRRDAGPRQPARHHPHLHAVLDQRQGRDHQGRRALPAVPRREAGGEAAARRQDARASAAASSGTRRAPANR